MATTEKTQEVNGNRFFVHRTTTDSGRSKIWGAYDSLHIFPAIQFRRGTSEENRALAERAAAVLNAGAWRDEKSLSAPPSP